ncbi:MAG: hypothetical protein ACJ71Q_15385 [Terriglobales bacterium]
MVSVALGLAFCTPALIAQRSMNSGIQFHGIPGSVTSPRPDGSLRGIPGSVTDPRAATGRGFHGSFTFGNGRSTFVPPRRHRPAPVYVVPYYGAYGAPYFYDYSDYEQQQVEPQQQAVQPQVIIIKEDGTQSSDNSRYGEHYFDGREGNRDSDHDQIAQSKPASPPEVSEDPGPMTTLVYRDGHKTEVRNYAIVGANLMDLTKTPVIKKIPLASLDLEATRHQNEENGVDFHLP